MPLTRDEEIYELLATARTIAELSEVVELNIGHFLIGEAVSVGLGEAVREMRRAMDWGRARAAAA